MALRYRSGHRTWLPWLLAELAMAHYSRESEPALTANPRPNECFDLRHVPLRPGTVILSHPLERVLPVQGQPAPFREFCTLSHHMQIGRYSFFMDSHFMLVRVVATLARRQIALEALLQGKGISKENIAEAAGQVPIPQIIPTR